MRLRVRHWTNQLLRSLGYELGKSDGRDLFHDIRRFIPGRDDLVIFDVGGNEGQTVRDFRKEYPRSTIHSFEPNATTFSKLKENLAGKEAAFAWNLALGSQVGSQTFFENSHSTMSSFHPLGTQGWGKTEKETTVQVTTVDQFCSEQKISRIDVLKSDTQGYDLEVCKGAEMLIREGRIGLIYCEVIFSEIYQDVPPFEELVRHLTGRDFRLEAIYQVHHYQKAAWTDALFVHESLRKRERRRRSADRPKIC